MKKILLSTLSLLFVASAAFGQCYTEVLSGGGTAGAGSTQTVTVRFMTLDVDSGTNTPAPADWSATCTNCSFTTIAGGGSENAAWQISVVLGPGGTTTFIEINAAGSTGGAGAGCASTPEQVFFTVLPVELTSFEGKTAEDFINLSWATASEINNDYFTVERSFDGKNFEAIGKVYGAGNSVEEVNYEFADETANRMATSNTAYYRLMQTDYDGTDNFHEVIAVELEARHALEVINVQDEMLYFEATTTGNMDVAIYNMNGQVLAQQNVTAIEGYNAIELNNNDLGKGMFIVHLTDGQQQAVKKFFR